METSTGTSGWNATYFEAGNSSFLPERGIWRELHFWFPPICFILGIIGNSLCLAALCISRFLLPPATRIYTSLILLSSDVLLTCAAVRWLCTSLPDYLPKSATSELHVVQEALLTETGCQIMEYFRTASLFVLVWLLVAMAGERYVTLARPFAVRTQPGCKALAVTAVVVLVAFGAAVSRFFTVMVVSAPSGGGGHWDNAATAQGIRYQRDCGLNDIGIMVLLGDVLVLYLLPPVFLAVLAVCLSCMLCEYNKYRKRQRRKPIVPPAGRNGTNKPRPELMARPHAELTLTLTYIFGLGLLPMFAWSVLTLVLVIWGPDANVEKVAKMALSVAQLLLLVLCASHLSYFVLSGGRFRTALCTTFCACGTQTNGHSSHSRSRNRDSPDTSIVHSSTLQTHLSDDGHNRQDQAPSNDQPPNEGNNGIATISHVNIGFDSEMTQL